MLYFEARPGEFVRWHGEPIGGILHPVEIERLWSAAELAAVGLFKPAPGAAAPAGHRVSSSNVERVGGVVQVVNQFEVVPVMPDHVERECARRLDLLGAGYTRQERETWATQVREAGLLVEDPAAAAPMLRGLAGVAGVPVPALAAAVLQKAAAFEAAAGAILGAKKALLAQSPIPATYADDGHWPNV
jgi:hypothetical protein